MYLINLSVHQIVDFILRRGSIDSRIYNANTMQEGTRIHLRYQNIQDGNYFSEIPLKCEIKYDNYILYVQGRADGVIKTKNRYIIDEIKSTNDELENFYNQQGEWHLGQALFYAYMYALDNNLDEMGIRLTYISQIDNSRMIKDFVFSFDMIEEKILQYVKEYTDFYDVIAKHKQLRNETASNIKFPFDDYRVGQKNLIKYVYKFVKDGGNFFFEAPTGTGKTISTIFPSIKTFADNSNDKIFYLSAKTQAKIVAHEAIKLLVNKGLDIYSIIISNKESMCQCDAMKCNPDECPFAVDYYEKVKSVISLVLSREKYINQDCVLKYALLYGICPFEFQLDLSLYCDFIICDYNYLFDPIAYLKRFFDADKTPYFALIDEAHNLSDRTKEMFTIALEKDKILSLSKSLKKVSVPSLKRKLKKLIMMMDEEVNNDENEYIIKEKDYSKSLYLSIDSLFVAMQEVLKEKNEIVNDEFVVVFKMINRFMKIREYLNENFITYIDRSDDLKLYIRCIDSSNIVTNTISKLRGAVIFSATLTPIEYYISTLGGDENTPYLRLPSSFKQENLCLLVRSDISTTYKERNKSYKEIALSIKEVVKNKLGNYLVFFSSYQYLTEVLNEYVRDDENIIVQNKDMSIKDRDEFLASFVENPTSTTIGFAVLGGVFSEGIDLVSDRLIGAIVVGVGLPMVSFERDLIKNYYNQKGMNGFDYAYTNPGKNKVMQAAGRVIRTKDDRGVVLLIDQRFGTYKYNDLFKLHWSHYRKVNSLESISNHLKSFWDENNLN